MVRHNNRKQIFTKFSLKRCKTQNWTATNIKFTFFSFYKHIFAYFSYSSAFSALAKLAFFNANIMVKARFFLTKNHEITVTAIKSYDTNYNAFSRFQEVFMIRNYAYKKTCTLCAKKSLKAERASRKRYLN